MRRAQTRQRAVLHEERAFRVRIKCALPRAHVREERAEGRREYVVRPRRREFPGFRVARRDGADPRQIPHEPKVGPAVVAAQDLEHGFERVDRVLQTLARRPQSRVDAGKDSDVGDDGVLAERARQARDVFVRASLFILAVVARRAHQVQGRAKSHRFRRRRRWRRRHVSHVSFGGVRWFRG